jgi:hypothetical protein
VLRSVNGRGRLLKTRSPRGPDHDLFDEGTEIVSLCVGTGCTKSGGLILQLEPIRRPAAALSDAHIIVNTGSVVLDHDVTNSRNS